MHEVNSLLILTIER